MDDMQLIEQVVQELDEVNRLKEKDNQMFKDEYSLLVDCAIDELNDEIMRNKLDGGAKYLNAPRFTLVQEGAHPVYRTEILSSYSFIGGEEFAIKAVERGASSAKSLINFLFSPCDPCNFNYLVLPYHQAMNFMDSDFAKAVATHLLPAMRSIEKDVIQLQHKYADRDRERMLDLLGGNQKIYKEANSW